MIQLPVDWLVSQFNGFLKCGAIIRFLPDDLDSPKNTRTYLKIV